jgi:hypothetical protein
VAAAHIGDDYIEPHRHPDSRGGWFRRRPAREGGDALRLQHRLIAAAHPQFPRVEPRERDGFRADVQTSAQCRGKLAEEGQADGTRAAAHVQNAEIPTGLSGRLGRPARCRQDELDQLLRLGTRDEHRRRHAQRELVEVPVADDVLDRRPPQSLQAHLFKRQAHRLGERPVPAAEEVGPRAQAGGVRQQVLCGQPGLGHVAGEEGLLGCRERRAEARRLGRQPEGPSRMRQQHGEARTDGHRLKRKGPEIGRRN